MRAPYDADFAALIRGLHHEGSLPHFISVVGAADSKAAAKPGFWASQDWGKIANAAASGVAPWIEKGLGQTGMFSPTPPVVSPSIPRAPSTPWPTYAAVGAAALVGITLLTLLLKKKST
jgi:hypothetical protein